MASLPKRKLLEKAEDAGIEVEVRGGGWFVVEGTKVRGLDDLEAAIDEALNAPETSRCLCGCGTEVQRTYSQGHDARLGGLLLRVARGEEDPNAIPDEARERLGELGSLLTKYDVEIEDVLTVVRGAS